MTRGSTVEIARHKERPRTRDYIDYLIDGFEELKGDRLRADDSAIVGGLGWFRGRAVLVVGHQKGRTLDELTQNNFGMANPEGYRKAQRLFKLAERHGLPVLTFVDTPGAYPGVAAEEGGQARAIAETMLRMARLTVPVIATIIGEGGSGGALALAVADRVLMLENATYSVITPEGCAAILWRDADFAPQAAEALRPTASQLLELMAVEKIVAEPRGWRRSQPGAGGAAPRRGDRRDARRARPDPGAGAAAAAPRAVPPPRPLERPRASARQSLALRRLLGPAGVNGRGEAAGCRRAGGRLLLVFALLVTAAAGAAACGGASSSDVGPYLGVWQSKAACATPPSHSRSPGRAPALP